MDVSDPPAVNRPWLKSGQIAVVATVDMRKVTHGKASAKTTSMDYSSPHLSTGQVNYFLLATTSRAKNAALISFDRAFGRRLARAFNLQIN
tara:strand:+ start:83 stop:355 length:273 start_codon:yes stop_codon:yes gene_type:complete